jgi:hydroxylaminobenzene mutase
VSDNPAGGNGPGQARCLALNGTLLMLTGLLCGLAIGAAPYPRLMLTAHIQFLVNGVVSVVAALLFATSLSVVGRRAGMLVIVGHVSTWAVCLSEVAGACWGASKALPIAAAQAGAPGALPWQESLLLLAAWAVIVWGVFQGRKPTLQAS